MLVPEPLHAEIFLQNSRVHVQKLIQFGGGNAIRRTNDESRALSKLSKIDKDPIFVGYWITKKWKLADFTSNSRYV